MTSSTPFVWEKLMRFISLRPRAEKEVDLWFAKKKIVGDEAAELKDRLCELKLLDDLEFARWWIDQRSTFRPKGKKLLIYELRQKGVGSQEIEQAFFESDFNELALAKKVLAKYAKLDWDRQSGLLARRGFSWETISQLTERSGQ